MQSIILITIVKTDISYNQAMKIYRKGGISAFFTFSIINCSIYQNLTKLNFSLTRLLCDSSSHYAEKQCNLTKGDNTKDNNTNRKQLQMNILFYKT